MESSLVETPPASDRIQDVAIVITREIQRSFARLISQLPGRVVRASHLQKCLEIDSKVAWQVFKIAKAEDPLDAVRYMPSMVSIKRVVAAAEREGVARDVLDAVQEAVSQYDAAGKQHADGRASFTSMITALRNDEAAEAVAVQTRRSAFRDNCQLWGSQVGVFFNQGVLLKRPSDEMVCINTTVKTDFRKLRTGALPVLYGYSQRSKEGKLIPVDRTPIDPEAFSKYGVPVLPQFCSKPIPDFGNAEMKDGWTVHKIQGEQIGKLGSFDLVTSYIYGDPHLVELSDGREIFFLSMAFRVPTETAIIELLVHRPSMGIISPQFRIIPEVGIDFVTELERQQPVMPNFETPQSLGRLPTAPPVSELRDYSELTTYVLNTQSWSKQEFDVYRVSISYPILHTLAVLWFEVSPTKKI
jgi:hypothetical protein